MAEAGIVHSSESEAPANGSTTRSPSSVSIRTKNSGSSDGNRSNRQYFRYVIAIGVSNRTRKLIAYIVTTKTRRGDAIHCREPPSFRVTRATAGIDRPKPVSFRTDRPHSRNPSSARARRVGLLIASNSETTCPQSKGVQEKDPRLVSLSACASAGADPTALFANWPTRSNHHPELYIQTHFTSLSCPRRFHSVHCLRCKPSICGIVPA